MNATKSSFRTALLVVATMVAVGCKPDSAGQERNVELVVFAASSLKEVFEAFEHEFEQAHPNVDVQPTFAGSQVLRLQIEQGASADLFVSANPNHMKALVETRHVSQRRIFADNALAVIVPLSNPAGIESFDDLNKATRIVVGTEYVPVGFYTHQLWERTREQRGEPFVEAVQQRIVSKESNVRLVRAKVELGEADAAIVYQTDANATDRVRAVPIPKALNVRARYSIGTLSRAQHPTYVALFVEHLFSSEGRETLKRHGFITEAK